MANNGNDPRLEKLSEQLRNVPAGVPALDPVKQTAHHPRELDNFTRRADLMAQACDELSSYSTSFAAHLRKISAEFHDNVAQMLGKLGK